MPITRREQAAEELAKLASKYGFVMVAVIADEQDDAGDPFLVVRGLDGRDCSASLILWAADEMAIAGEQIRSDTKEYIH